MFSVGMVTGDIAGIAADILLAIYSGGATAGMKIAAGSGNALILVSEGAALGSLVEAGTIVDALKNGSALGNDLGDLINSIKGNESDLSDGISIGSYDDLPQNAKDSYDKYEQAGWQGNVSGQTPGTNAGRNWGNIDSQLPTVDSNGNPITYKEFDVNNYNGVRRDSERFIVGSDGSVWYTDSHYGQGISINGISDFMKIK